MNQLNIYGQKFKGERKILHVLSAYFSKIEEERNIHDNWRQQLRLTCINQDPKKINKMKKHIISFPKFQQTKFSIQMLPCPTISDQDAPCIIANMPVNKFDTKYKYIRNLKNFELEKNVQDLKTLLIYLVYSFDDLNDQLDTFHKLTLNAINEHAPLMKTRFTRPSAPWMKDFEINKLQKEWDHWRHEAHSKQTPQS